MKKLILISSLMLLVMSAVAAQAGPIKGTGMSPDPVTTPPMSEDRRDDNPGRPVPEPGTMALASMGLIALGAAARGRRNNK